MPLSSACDGPSADDSGGLGFGLVHKRRGSQRFGRDWRLSCIGRQRIRPTDIGVDSRDSSSQSRKDSSLGAVARNQVIHVDRALLADPIDPADALLEAHRIPRQLEVDDQTTRALKVEPLGGRIGGKQQTRRGRL